MDTRQSVERIAELEAERDHYKEELEHIASLRCYYGCSTVAYHALHKEFEKTLPNTNPQATSK